MGDLLFVGIRLGRNYGVEFSPGICAATFLLLAGLLELICVIIYFASQSFWLTTLVHWSVVTIWLFPMGGRYQMWRTQIIRVKK